MYLQAVLSLSLIHILLLSATCYLVKLPVQHSLKDFLWKTQQDICVLCVLLFNVKVCHNSYPSAFCHIQQREHFSSTAAFHGFLKSNLCLLWVIFRVDTARALGQFPIFKHLVQHSITYLGLFSLTLPSCQTNSKSLWVMSFWWSKRDGHSRPISEVVCVWGILSPVVFVDSHCSGAARFHG